MHLRIAIPDIMFEQQKPIGHLHLNAVAICIRQVPNPISKLINAMMRLRNS
jgi:hypothetical protein